MPPSCVGAIRHSSVRISVGDVELGLAELGDGPVARLLHPPLQRVGAVQLAARVAVEERDRLGDGCPRLDLARDRLLLGDHARELLDAPLVGLVEVDDGAEEVPRPERVDVAADGVALRPRPAGARPRGTRRGCRTRMPRRRPRARARVAAARPVRRRRPSRSRRTCRRSRRAVRCGAPAPRPRATCRTAGTTPSAAPARRVAM